MYPSLEMVVEEQVGMLCVCKMDFFSSEKGRGLLIYFMSVEFDWVVSRFYQAPKIAEVKAGSQVM